ncbi:hypothetical protein DICPUDRAFT_55461 [Dictyostelium purpureum]|uniref:Mitochondrial substrate carrier family protein n=1 Tax=Dictyostelium purpureum TaxID=5786 RepID=F0ZM87_DICPU|nr:uncharacterized protein DICPUDRAFT_55461 [Dictyostelium purpureum]EGC34953.1 hypothetical protein DICPUDRAFT_55461 [Dictyostelium purpureum]|eukprot:XP_003288534.1 hypothetical protein DICPUDRAFT_55461 [Dictyostelium purpureum]
MVNGEELIESQTLVDEEVELKGKFNLKTELLAGTLAGVSSCILFYPLECIEAKLQVQSSIPTGTQAAANIIKDKKRPMNMGVSIGAQNSIGPVTLAKNILRTEGIKGFYQGVSPTILGNAVNWGVYFSIYRATNHWWNMPDINGNVYEGPAWVGHSVSAIAAGFITTAIVNPFWVLKIRLATTKKYSGIGHAFHSILRSEGVGGFWKGVGISFIGVSEGLFQFVSYEYILDQIRASNQNHQLSVGNYLFAGGAARFIAGCITYPYLLIRSSLQSEPCQYKSMSEAIRGIYKSEGIKGFYKGIGPNLARSVPPAAFMLYIVEFFRNLLTSS